MIFFFVFWTKWVVARENMVITITEKRLKKNYVL